MNNCFTFKKFLAFPISTRVHITVYQHGKMFYDFFIILPCQKPEGYEKFPCLQVAGNFQRLHYVNTALNHSAFWIHKCYIIIQNCLH